MSKGNYTSELGTESRLPETHWIDRLSVDESLSVLLDSQAGAVVAIRQALPEISIACEALFKRLSSSSAGRIIYSGAGTSARISVQDGAELLPTFNWPAERVAFVIAGGTGALLQAVENAEDDDEEAQTSCEKLLINADDCMIGLGASGRTPFTLSAIKYARRCGALTIGISNNPHTALLLEAEMAICLDTGAEALTGSTRLKAGTAQKICLNLLSTQVMVMMGRVKDGLMSEMVPRNEKLRRRKVEIEQALSHFGDPDML